LEPGRRWNRQEGDQNRTDIQKLTTSLGTASSALKKAVVQKLGQQMLTQAYERWESPRALLCPMQYRLGEYRLTENIVGIRNSVQVFKMREQGAKAKK